MQKENQEKESTRIKTVKELESLKKSYENLVDENNDLCDKDCQDVFTKIYVNEDVAESGVTISEDTPGHLCVSCEKRFRTNRDLERHIDTNHVQVECSFSDRIFRNKNIMEKHTETCIALGVSKVECDTCGKTFASWGMGKHKSRCHARQKELECAKCGLLINDIQTLKSHMVQNAHKIGNGMEAHHKNDYII